MQMILDQHGRSKPRAVCVLPYWPFALLTTHTAYMELRDGKDGMQVYCGARRSDAGQEWYIITNPNDAASLL